MQQFTRKEFIKICEYNGYHYARHSGDHYIYVNDAGRHISIPETMQCVIALRLIKEYNLKINKKGKKHG